MDCLLECISASGINFALHLARVARCCGDRFSCCAFEFIVLHLDQFPMADIRAFRAFRYDLGKVGALSDVVCPPYDVIDLVLQQALYNLSPYNVVRLELNQPEPSDSDVSNRYTRAAAFLRDWKS